MELTQEGELIIMSPTGGEAGRKNFNLYLDLGIWNRQTKLGKAFDSSTLFILPNGARRSPDVSWIKLERWNGLNLYYLERSREMVCKFCCFSILYT